MTMSKTYCHFYLIGGFREVVIILYIMKERARKELSFYVKT